MKPLRYVDAVKIREALNFASLPPPADSPSRVLTADERLALHHVIHGATIAPGDCTHLTWEWPMPRCPECGDDGAAPRT